MKYLQKKELFNFLFNIGLDAFLEIPNEWVLMDKELWKKKSAEKSVGWL